MIELTNDSTNQNFIACNPLTRTYHIGESNNSITRSGQPFMIYGKGSQFVSSLIFDSYDKDDETGEEVYIEHPITWSVYDNEVEVIGVIDFINNLDFLYVNSIKHNTDQKWAIPFSQKVFDSIESGVIKDTLELAHNTSIAAGRVFTTSELISQGWV